MMSEEGTQVGSDARIRSSAQLSMDVCKLVYDTMIFLLIAFLSPSLPSLHPFHIFGHTHEHFTRFTKDRVPISFKIAMELWKSTLVRKVWSTLITTQHEWTYP